MSVYIDSPTEFSERIAQKFRSERIEMAAHKNTRRSDTVTLVWYSGAENWCWAYELGNVLEKYVSGVSQIRKTMEL